jgi:hypothetical protein
LVGVESQTSGDLEQVLIANNVAGVLKHNRHRSVGGTGAMFRSIKRRRIKDSVESELQERFCLCDCGGERFGIGLCEIGGIGTAGENRNSNIEVVLLFPGVDARCGILTSSISVECEDNALGKTAQQLHMIFGKSSSAGCNSARHTRFKETNNVGVALADDRFIGLYDVGFRHVEAIEQLRLAVDRTIDRVLVLRSVDTRHDAPTETDICSGDIVDGEHDAPAKRVGGTIATVDETQTGFDEDVVGNFDCTSEFVPALGCPSDTEVSNIVAIETAGT